MLTRRHLRHSISLVIYYPMNMERDYRNIPGHWVKRPNTISRRFSSDSATNNPGVTIEVKGGRERWIDCRDDHFHDVIESEGYEVVTYSNKRTGTHGENGFAYMQDVCNSSSASSAASSGSGRSSKPLSDRIGAVRPGEPVEAGSSERNQTHAPVNLPGTHSAETPGETKYDDTTVAPSNKGKPEEKSRKENETTKNEETFSWTQLQRRVSATQKLGRDHDGNKNTEEKVASEKSPSKNKTTSQTKEEIKESPNPVGLSISDPEISDREKYANNTVSVQTNELFAGSAVGAPEASAQVEDGVNVGDATEKREKNKLTFQGVAKDVAQQVRILVALRRLKKASDQPPQKRKASVVTPKIQLMCEMLETHNRHKIDLSKADSDELLGSKEKSDKRNEEKPLNEIPRPVDFKPHGSKVHFESSERKHSSLTRVSLGKNLEEGQSSKQDGKTKTSVVSLNQEVPDEKQLEHFAQLGRFVRNLYSRDQLSDIVLSVGCHTFSAHKVVLACHSGLLAEKLLHKNETSTIELDTDITPFALQLILEFMYTGRMRADHENIVEVLNASSLLKISVLEEHCLAALSDLTAPELLPVLQVAMNQSQRQAENEEIQWRTVACNFMEVVASEQFAQASLECVCELLRRDDLAVTSEADVAYGAVRWMEHNRQEREPFVRPIMACIRWPLIAVNDILSITNMAEYLLADDPTRKTLLKAIWYRSCVDQNLPCELDVSIPTPRVIITTSTPFSELIQKDLGEGEPKLVMNASLRSFLEEQDLPRESRTPSIHPTNCSPPPSPGAAPNVHGLCVLAFGGYNTHTIKGRFPGQCVERFDVRGNFWEPFSTLPEPLAHHAVTLQAGLIYISGGTIGNVPNEESEDNKATDRVLVFNPMKMTWDKCPSMLESRAYHSMVSVCGVLYAIGGMDHEGIILSSVEHYSPGSMEWVAGPPMSSARLGAAVAVVNGGVLVAGGYGGPDPDKPEVLDSVELFNPLTNNWVVTPTTLQTPRFYASMATVAGKLYICGGISLDPTTQKQRAVETVDVYDELDDSWWPVSKLSLPRYDAGCAAVGSRLYIIGGISLQDKKATHSIECYNVAKAVWETNMEDLHMATAGARCVALS